MDKLHLAPLIDKSWIIALIILGAVVVAPMLIMRKKGAASRAFLWLFLVILLLNPKWQTYQTKILPSIVAIIVDKSESQKLSGRLSQTEIALDQLKKRLSQISNLEVRILPFYNEKLDETTQTDLFSALKTITTDIPPQRLAGAIFITDGQIHDIPQQNKDINFPAPLHALITGNGKEFDRIITLNHRPSFGLMKKKLQLSFTIYDEGKMPLQNQDAVVKLNINGQDSGKTYYAKIGQETKISLDLPHPGENIITISTPPIAGELSEANNQAVLNLHAIQDHLQVLLVSGEPYNGERLWRNLLKSDPNIDLVHFTILRPPEKALNTPIGELSLITFPVQELFVHKINHFDLIILDRYQDYNVLPKLYYAFMANYVRQGGGLLIITGPEFVEPSSIAESPLSTILPAQATEVKEQAFQAQKTPLGRRHPITRDLKEDKKWGPWLRYLKAENPKQNPVLLEGLNHDPILVVNHVEKGRIALLLSDESWLWARNFEGGGPYNAFYRNLALWLTKTIHDETLKTEIKNDTLFIVRNSLKDKIEPIKVIDPQGKEEHYKLEAEQNGQFSLKIPAKKHGFYHIYSGNLQSIAYSKTVNAPEFLHLIPDTKKLEPIITALGGNLFTLGVDNTVPPVKLTTSQNDRSSLFLRPSQAQQILSFKEESLWANWPILLLGLCLVTFLWYRESYS